MKKLAAQDFEDILQCCIAVFEGLLPEPHNTIVLTLLFTFATWHAYAKLCLHSSLTIRSFRIVDLGSKARKFIRTTCSIYVTYELPQEESRRARRKAQKKAKSPGNNPNLVVTKSPKTRKEWNITTYKWHSLGDYADTIVDFGTTDSYSTQIGELAHRLAKKFYVKTNKHNFEWQIAAHEQRQRLLRGIKQRMDETAAAGANPSPSDETATQQPDPLPQAPPPPRSKNALAPEDDVLSRTPPRQHHHISESKRTWLSTWELPNDFPNEPALTNFLPDLKSHLLGRLLGIPYDGDESQYSIQDLADVNIIGEHLYTHKVLRINYTTYDVLRDQDTLNTRTHPDFMVLAHEDEEQSSPHPYWYGRIISIFHAKVRHVGPKLTRFLSATTMPTVDAAAVAAATLLALATPAPAPAPPPSAAKRKYDEILDLLGAPPVVAGKRAKRDSLETKSPLEKLLSLAKYFVRAVHPFMDIGLVLFYGSEANWTTPAPSVASNSITVPESERAEQKRHVDAFDKMMAKSPDSLDILREFYKDNKQWSRIVKLFREAAASARQNETSGLKHKTKYVLDTVCNLLPAVSESASKSDRGINHPMLRDAIIPWPLRIQINEVLRHLWTVPSSAIERKDRLSLTCNARAHGQFTMISTMIAYGCVQARTILSTSDWTAKDGSYDYVKLFNSVVALFETDPTDAWAVDTLKWYQEGVFGSGDAALASSGSSDSDNEDSEAAAILARRAARRTTTPDSS
ncbi:hypothetical protein C8R44DRAFT_878566 [Mycena epipterygia]|nr:hypothetical protein C8R44DRAFT_878566 [Mycena epipterygia]